MRRRREREKEGDQLFPMWETCVLVWVGLEGGSGKEGRGGGCRD